MAVGHAGGGGVLRDHNRNWMWGFAVKLGRCSVIEAEIWSIIHGLRLAWEKGLRQLVLEMNSLMAANWIIELEKADNMH